MFKRVFLILLGIAIGLIAIEISLRIAGHIYYSFWMRQEYKMVVSEEDEVVKIERKQKVSVEDTTLVKILCMGDSWTFGAGADPGYSYPVQLQLLLDKENLHKYRVYNLGIPGLHSEKLLRYLPEFLKKYEPNIVIILIGKNDIWNYPPSELVYLLTWPRSFYFTLASAISDLRVYKLIRLGLDGLMQKAKGFKKDVASANEKVKSQANQWAVTGHDLYTAGKFDLGEAYLKKAIDIDPGNERVYLYLGHLYQAIQRYDKSLFFFEKLLEINPHTPLRAEIYRFLFSMYQEQSYPQDIRNKIIYLIKKIPSDDAFKNPGAPFILNSELTIRNLENNLRKIIDLIRAKKATPILLTYLYRDIHSPFNGLMRDFSKKHDILLVDNAKNLVSLSDIDSYFAAGGHPNEKGYRLIAENIYKVLKIN